MRSSENRRKTAKKIQVDPDDSEEKFRTNAGNLKND